LNANDINELPADLFSRCSKVYRSKSDSMTLDGNCFINHVSNFFKVIAKRCEEGSVILSLILSFGDREQAFGGNTALTSAMLNRLSHHFHVIQIRGDKYHMKEKTTLTQLGLSTEHSPTR